MTSKNLLKAEKEHLGRYGTTPMNRQQLTDQSEQCLQKLLREYLPPQTPVHLFGSRARKQNRWNSDFDLWIEADIDLVTKGKLEDAIEESIIPFKVDIAPRVRIVVAPI